MSMTWNPSPRQIGRLKAILFLAALLPASRLLLAAYTGDFGANPVEFVQRFTGTWTFNFLVLTLAVSPLRALTQAHWLLRLRRMLGLFTFFYGTLHFLAFVGFDHSFEIQEIARDVVKRPFVTVGFAALAVMLPLALTSNQFAIRTLGGKRWQELHRSIYLIAILATLHYFWLVKATAILWPIGYGAVVALLLGWRAKERIRRHGPFPTSQPRPTQTIRFFDQRPK